MKGSSQTHTANIRCYPKLSTFKRKFVAPLSKHRHEAKTTPRQHTLDFKTGPCNDPDLTHSHALLQTYKHSHVCSELTKSRHIISRVFSLQRSRTRSSRLPINSSYQLTMCVCESGCLCVCDRDTGRAQGVSGRPICGAAMR